MIGFLNRLSRRRRKGKVEFVATNIEGTGWKMIRPKPTWGHRGDETSIESLVPEAPWFWHALQRSCVPECCGLAAYDFEPTFVRWVSGATDVEPEAPSWRDDNRGDHFELADELRQAATAIRALKVEAVDARRLFNEVLKPESYGELFDRLAAIIDAKDQD